MVQRVVSTLSGVTNVIDTLLGLLGKKSESDKLVWTLEEFIWRLEAMRDIYVQVQNGKPLQEMIKTKAVDPWASRFGDWSDAKNLSKTSLMHMSGSMAFSKTIEAVELNAEAGGSLADVTKRMHAAEEREKAVLLQAQAAEERAERAEEALRAGEAALMA